jgi:hypothetical protein
MALQDGCRPHVGDLAFEHMLDGVRLALIGDRHDDAFTGKDALHGHRYGFGRDRQKIGEPSLPDLLQATRRIERHFLVGNSRSEIGWRVIECQVAVLANSRKGDVNRMLVDQGVETVDLPRQIRRIAFYEVEGAQSRQFAGEALPEIPAEAGFVGCGYSHIFVKMEGGHHGPIDIRILDQFL